METFFLTLLNVFKSICFSIGDAWNWLTSVWFTYGSGETAVEVTPIMLFSVTGLLIVAAVMLIKFLNPTN